MAHKLRYVPAGSLVEVTCRTVNSLLLLRPTRRVNETIVGIVGRAQRVHEIAIHTIVVQSNHFHMLVSPRDAQHLAKFMGLVNSNIARKVGKLVDAGGSGVGGTRPFPSARRRKRRSRASGITWSTGRKRISFCRRANGPASTARRRSPTDR